MLHEEEPWLLLEAGFGGTHALTSTGTSIATCSVELARFFPRLSEGGWVIDKRALLDRSESPHLLCINAPLPDLTIPDGQRGPSFLVPEHMLGPLGLQGAFLTLPSTDSSVPNYDGLQCVALDVYVAYWRRLGARIGRRSGPSIAWEPNDGPPNTAIAELTGCTEDPIDVVEGLPVYVGKDARRQLTRRWGLPNSAPREWEWIFGRCRVMFVDDDEDGRPVAYWIPD